MFAIGRRALTKELKPENAGLILVEETGKIDAVNEQTNVPNIFAVGDVLHVKILFICFHLNNFTYEKYSFKFLLLFIFNKKLTVVEKTRADTSGHPRREIAS